MLSKRRCAGSDPNELGGEGSIDGSETLISISKPFTESLLTGKSRPAIVSN